MSGRRPAAWAGLALVGALCWWMALRAGVEASRVPDTASLRYHTPRIGMADLERVRQEQKRQEEGRLAFSAFVQLDGEELETKEYEKKATAGVLFFSGEVRLIMNPRGMDGAFVSSADSGGCALDADTAYRLWGSRNVQGETLTWDGKDYTVRAVFDSPSGAVLIPADRGTNRRFSALSLDTRGAADARKAAQDFRSLHGLPEPDATLTSGWLPGTARFFALLPALALGAALLWRLLREWWALREYPVQMGLAALAVAAAAALAVWASGVRFELPSGLTPTRWSDFEFWARTLRGIWENLRDAAAARRLLPDGVLGAVLARAALGGTICAAALMIFWRKWWGGQETED